MDHWGSAPAAGAFQSGLLLPSPHPLPRYRATHEPPEQPSGDGWLVSAEQQKVVQFKPDASTAHAQWVVVRLSLIHISEPTRP